MSDIGQLLASTLPIEARRSIPKTLLALIGCAAFAGGGFWLLGMRHGTPGAWVGIPCVAFFGLGGLVSLVSLFDKRPRIRLDRQGVWVRGWKGCPIEWSDIQRAWTYQQRGATGYGQVRIDYVCVSLRHAESFLGKQGPVGKRVASYFRSKGMGDVYFSTQGMDVDADGLVAAIQSHIGGAHLSPVESLLPMGEEQG